jgi:glutaminyl-tRNA synthetase
MTNSPATIPPSHEAARPSNFLRQIIEHDLSVGTYATRKWVGTPGDATHQNTGSADPAKVRLRFPPEPNGYLHIGHAKSICINFGLAKEYGGVCHMRFDDTNPEKEDTEYVNSILDAVKWLGFGWEFNNTQHLYQASDYFEYMYSAATALIKAGCAYVDEQTPEQMRLNRGDFGSPGINSPFRSQSADQNLKRFNEMRSGLLPDASAVLRAKIDMAHPNINMRDPVIYRIRHVTHHHTGNKWCIYPMYTFAHPIEDALEQITHSICTLEFEDQRPFYDWLLQRLIEAGMFQSPPPRQYEFARLNLTYVLTSKRKLKQLVDEKRVNGWDDPRMPTIAGLRRRGYTPESLQLFAERIGVTKSDSWIDYSTLEIALRDDLDPKAARASVVLDPLKLRITNWDSLMGEGHLEPCKAPVHPHQPERGLRNFKMGSEVWIERADYQDTPVKGFFRLFPGNKVRLKYGFVIECTGCVKNSDGEITEVLATLIPNTKSGTPGSDSVKVKGVITWVGVHEALSIEVRLYERLFTEAHPDAGGRDPLSCLNPNSLRIIKGFSEPDLIKSGSDEKFQFERHGYFAADRVDHCVNSPVFNKITGLKDQWNN